MAFDDSVDMNAIVLRIARFFRDESCGQCVPCRVGTVRQEEALYRLATRDSPEDIAMLSDIGGAMRDASICGLGQTASAPASTWLTAVRASSSSVASLSTSPSAQAAP